MPRLLIIDHSLIAPGGHHYEYDLHVARAAECAGWEPVLATNRRFAPHADRLAPWRVLPVFRNDAYNRFTVTSGASALPQHPWRHGWWRRATVPAGTPAALRPWRKAALLMKQRRRLGRFVRGCRRLFDAVPVQAGDLVFVPTLSEFDLVALVRFLAGHPGAATADWHLQFHLNFLDGTEPEQAQQSERLEAMRAHFTAALAGFDAGRLHFHATTAQLAAQYNRLGVARFEALDYPVSPAFRPAGDAPATGPLRMLCAGGARSEKGTSHLDEVVRACWHEFFAGARLRLLVQVQSDAQMPAAPAGGPAGAISRVPFPLDADAYCALIREADIGLFLYDPRRYYGRCSGVLVEMLCAGVPVIVPAACWLADEIAEANFRHLDDVHGGALAPVALAAAAVPGGRAVFRAAVPAGATALLASFTRVRPSGAGHFLRIVLAQADDAGATVDRQVTITGDREGGRPARVLGHLAPAARQVELSITHTLDIDFDLAGVELVFVAAGKWPLGAVGLTAAGIGEIPRLLRDMVANYPHYRRAARAFAADYARRHSPGALLARLGIGDG